MSELDGLVALAGGALPVSALGAASVVLVHDLAVAASGRSFAGELLGDVRPEGGGVVDLATGREVAPVEAVVRNGQLIHTLTQDDTLLPAMTHVGATSIPLLLAHGSLAGAGCADLVAAFATAFAAAEAIGSVVSPTLAARGVRPTPVVGLLASQVGVARLLGWDPVRTARAVAMAAAVAFGTSQAWLDGSQEWLFEIGAAGALGWLASTSSAGPWTSATEPLWGRAGLFPALGVERPAANDVADPDGHVDAATRASVKRFPVCAINQVPLALLQAAGRCRPSLDGVSIRLSVPEATYPGTDRTAGLETWTTRLMSLPYCAAVMATQGDFVVDDLRRPPPGLIAADVAAVRLEGDPDLAMGRYAVTVGAGGATERRFEGDVDEHGAPVRAQLERAATAAVGAARVERLCRLVDADAPIAELAGEAAAR